jgi:hypothetical protein
MDTIVFDEPVQLSAASPGGAVGAICPVYCSPEGPYAASGRLEEQLPQEPTPSGPTPRHVSCLEPLGIGLVVFGCRRVREHGGGSTQFSLNGRAGTRTLASLPLKT